LKKIQSFCRFVFYAFVVLGVISAVAVGVGDGLRKAFLFSLGYFVVLCVVGGVLTLILMPFGLELFDTDAEIKREAKRWKKESERIRKLYPGAECSNCAHIRSYPSPIHGTPISVCGRGNSVLALCGHYKR